MKKILINIQNHSLIFSIKYHEVIREDLLNTNIISDSELVFSDDYIKENTRIVIPFFKELCQTNQITTLVFQNMNLAYFIIDSFKSIKIENIKIKKEENISYTFCEKIILLKSLESLECYSIPNFLIELLDKHHIKVITHSEVFYISSFMQENKLTSYSNIYYKKEIIIREKLTSESQEDLLSFLQMNHYLKIISFDTFNRLDLEFILTNLKSNHFKNIYIEINQNVNKDEDITYLKHLNKLYQKKKYQINLVYSDEYLKDNLMKQIAINTVKLCTIFIITMLLSIISYVMVRNYYALKEVSTIQYKVNETIAQTEEEDLPEKKDNYVIKNKYIASLLAINPDVVGYLKVNNTAIDYPVVLASDNLYYLKYNLYKEKDQNGWVFMDFRNSDKIINNNTIIYGHNMYYSGVMFGTLHKVLNANWYNNKDNLTIQFDTLYESMKWQIYSIYTIPKTSDYLKVSFPTEEEFTDYINLTKNRSIKDFGIEVTTKDHLLTLSTCTGDTDRLVVHAKLIENT